jgi:hypothetical protein
MKVDLTLMLFCPDAQPYVRGPSTMFAQLIEDRRYDIGEPAPHAGADVLVHVLRHLLLVHAEGGVIELEGVA